MKNYGDLEGCYPPQRILPFSISIILHMIRKPNSIIVHLRQYTFRFVQLHKYSPNSRCRPSSCLLAVLATFLAMFSASSQGLFTWSGGTPVQWGRFLLFCVPQSVKTKETNPTRPGFPTPCKQALTLETSEMSAIFQVDNKTTQSHPQVFLVNSALTCANAAFLTSFPR